MLERELHSSGTLLLSWSSSSVNLAEIRSKPLSLSFMKSPRPRKSSVSTTDRFKAQRVSSQPRFPTPWELSSRNASTNFKAGHKRTRGKAGGGKKDSNFTQRGRKKKWSLLAGLSSFGSNDMLEHSAVTLNKFKSTDVLFPLWVSPCWTTR